mgnify:CR=1 FL=1
MKDFIKFFSIITGLFRSVISILLLLSIGFVIFVDNNLFLATFDLLGINNISAVALKPIALGILIVAFVINTVITRSIFKAGENGKSHLANVFFGLLFLAIDAFLYLYFREKLLYILLGFNGLLVLNSLIGLIAKFKGVYNTNIPEKKTEYIEVKTETNDSDKNNNPIKLDFKDNKDEDVKILEKDNTEIDGKTVIRSSRLIKKDTDLNTNSKPNDFKEERNKLINNEENPEVEDKTLQKSDAKVLKEKVFEGEKTTAEKEAEEKLDENSPKTLGDVEKENKKVNKVVKDLGSTDDTYDPDLADDFKKHEEEKIYQKSNFVKNED